MILKDVLRQIDFICPFSLQEDWDNSGLQIGSPNAEISKVLIAFDMNETVLGEAIEKKADMILTHHPFFFRGIKEINLSEGKGRMISGLLCNNIALVSCHTNLDKIDFGVSAVLGNILGLKECRPFIPCSENCGFGVIGFVPEPCSLGEFAELVRDCLGLSAVSVCGSSSRMIHRVAAMGGAGADFIGDAASQGADVYVCGDFRYHDGQRACELGLSLIDAGHFPTEYRVMKPFAEMLRKKMPGITFETSEKMESYWSVCLK